MAAIYYIMDESYSSMYDFSVIIAKYIFALDKRYRLVDVEANQHVIDKSHNLFRVLASIDNLKVFSAARSGLKASKPLLDKLGIPKRRFHKAVEQLKDAGLIKKGTEEEQIASASSSSSSYSSSSYIHTKFGSIIYQRYILEMDQYSNDSVQMKMMDTIRQVQNSPDVVAMFNEQIISNIINGRGNSSSSSSNNFQSPSSPSSSSTTSNQQYFDDQDIATTTVSKASIILSYDNIIQLLRERIESCRNEILIATRISPELIINKVLEKSKLGINVRVVADIDLVRGYFESQEKFTVDSSNVAATSGSSTDNNSGNNNINNQMNKERYSANMNDISQDRQQQLHEEERREIISNPYYPNTAIHRRISDIPFSMIILDSNEVGLELVNSNNTKEFFAGVWIKDEKFAMAIKTFYQTIWDNASENIEPLKRGE